MERSSVPPAEALRFFGRTVAGTTHELVNVLNIVGELAGLQDDLLRGVAAGRPLDLAKLSTLAERTRAQTERGHALLRHLNRFAHSVDHECVSYDLGDLFDTFAALAERTVRLARARLTVRPPLATLVLLGSPFAAHLALSLCLDAVLQGSPPNREVHLSAHPTPAGATVIVGGSGAWGVAWEPSREEPLRQALAACPGRIVSISAADQAPLFTVELLDLAHLGAEHGENRHAS